MTANPPLAIEEKALDLDEASQIFPHINMDCVTLSRQLTDTVHNDTPLAQDTHTAGNAYYDDTSSPLLTGFDVPCKISRQKTDDASAKHHDDDNDNDAAALHFPPVIARQRTNAAPQGPQTTITALHDLMPSGLQRQLTDEIMYKEPTGTDRKHSTDRVDDITVDKLCVLPHLDDISRQSTDAAQAQMLMNPIKADAMEISYLPPKVKNNDKEDTIALHDSDMNNPFLDENLLMFDDQGKLLDIDSETGTFMRLNNENDNASVHSIEDDSLNQFIEHREPIICIAFNPKKEYELCSGGQDEYCYIWNILKYDPSDAMNKDENDIKESGCSYVKMKDHSDTIIDCAWNSSGKFIATASMDSCIKVYNCNKNYKLVSSLDIGDEISYIEWHPNMDNEKKYRNILMTGGLDKNVWIYEYDKTQKIFESRQILSGHSGKIQCGGFTKYNNGTCGYSGDEDGVIIIWDNIVDSDAFKGRKKWIFKPNKDNVTLYHESGINVLDDCAMAPLLISGSSDHSVCLINYENGKILQKLGKHLDSVECVKFNKLHKNYSSSSSVDGMIKVWDLNNGKIRSELEHDDGVVVHEWFNTERNADLIVSGGMDGVVYVWDARDGHKVKQFKGHQKCSIQTIKISKDDQYIVSAGDDSIAMVWKM